MTKSVLDNMQVKEQGFPISEKYTGNKPDLVIVSACPTCGCPIYGHSTVSASDTPEVKRTCLCIVGRTISMETK